MPCEQACVAYDLWGQPLWLERTMLSKHIMRTKEYDFAFQNRIRALNAILDIQIRVLVLKCNLGCSKSHPDA